MPVKKFTAAILLAGLCMPAQPGDSQAELEQKISETIHSACHGYAIDMIPDLLSFARDWLGENSPVCKDLRTQGYDYDVASTLKRHRVGFSAEDSKRIGELYDAWRFKDLNLQIECDSEYMCMRVRKELQEKNVPATQKQYQQVADHCEKSLAPYSCIQNWFRDEWIARGNRTLPGQKTVVESKFGLDELMQDSRPVTQRKSSTGNGLNLDDLMADSNVEPLRQKSGNSPGNAIGFDDIYQARTEIRITKSQNDLAAKNRKIAQRCECTQDGVSCFTAGSYRHQQLSQSMLQADDNYESQQRKVCGEWVNALRGRSSDSAEVLAGLHQNTDIVLANLDKLAGNYKKIVSELDGKQNRIELAIKRQKEQQQAAEDSAAFGKALAIGLVGVVAAGSDLPADQAVEVFSAVTQDILEETGGTNIMALTQDYQTQSLNLQSTFSSSGSSNGNNAGSLTLTCKMQGVCAEYSFSSSQDREKFASSCANVVNGSCPAGPSCSQSEGGRTVKTFSYERSAAEVRKICERGQGTFSN